MRWQGGPVHSLALALALSLSLTGCLQTENLAGSNNSDTPQLIGFAGCLSATGTTTSSIQVQYEWPSGAQSVSILRNGIGVYTGFSGSAGIYLDEGLLEGRSYTYTCSATFAKSNGSMSVSTGTNAVVGTTISIHAPTFEGLRQVVEDGPSSVVVSWPVADGVPTARYLVVAKLGAAPVDADFDAQNTSTQEKIGGGRLKLLTITNPFETSTRITGLGEQLEYHYAVRACSAGGVCSMGSTVPNVLTKTISDHEAPRTAGVSLAQLVEGQIVLTAAWKPEDGQVSLRRIYRSLTGGPNISNYVNVQNIAVSDPNDVPTSLTLTGTVSEGSTYHYIVRDEDMSGRLSSNLSVASITVGDLTPPPGFLGIRPSADLESTVQGEILIKWNAPADWSDYRGFRIFTVRPDQSLQLVKDCVCADGNCAVNPLTQCPVTGLIPFRTYKFHVRAFDASGNLTTYLNPVSSFAQKRAADTAPPSFVSNLIVGYASGVTLSWAAGSDNQDATEPGAVLSYQVWRKTGSPFVAPTSPQSDADGGAPLATIPDVQYIDTAITGGSIYYYTICVLDASLNRTCDGNTGFRSVPDVTPPSLSTITDNKTLTSKTWTLSWSISDDITANAQLSVAIRRKVSSSATDFPSVGDAVETAGQNLTSLTNEGSSTIPGTAGVNRYVNYRISVTDLAGNVTSATHSVHLDNSPPSSLPALTSLTPSSPSSVSSTPVAVGQVSTDTTTVGLYSDIACLSLLASGTKAQFEGAGLTLSLPQNAMTSIYARAKTAADNWGDCTPVGTFTHDNQAPTLASLTINGPSFRGASDLNWSISWGSASSDVSFYCLLQNSTSISSCSWVPGATFPATFAASAVEGSNYLSVWVRDATGNTSARISSNTITMDATAPSWLATLNVPAWTTSASTFADVGGNPLPVTISLNATDANSIDHYEYAIGTGNSSPTWSNIKGWTTFSTGSFVPSGLSLFHGSTYYVNVRAFDTAGNQTLKSAAFQVDLVDPQIPEILSAYDGQNLSAPGGRLQVTGSCESGTANVLTVNGGTGVAVKSSSCVDDALAITVQLSGLTLSGTTVDREIQAFTTKPSGRFSATSTRTIAALGSCPENYVKVFGNAAYGTDDFCVAKFEMRAVTTNPLLGSAALANGNGNQPYNAAWFPDSRPTGTPFVNITQRNAVLNCDKLNETTGGTGPYQLITNAQWQTLAASLESGAGNWSGGAVGSGQLPRGHTDNALSDPNIGTTAGLAYGGHRALASASQDGTTWPWNFADSAAELAAGYRGTGNSSANAVGSGWEQRRTHLLPSGEVIWDVAGNVWEWVRFTEAAGNIDTGITGNTAGTFNSRTLPVQSGNFGGTNWYELNNTNIFSDLTGTGAILSSWFQPSLSYSPNPSAYSLGRIYSVSNGAINSYAVLRGGDGNDGDNVGVFAATLNLGPTNATNEIGFRCAFRP